jgi:hypothetical protein
MEFDAQVQGRWKAAVVFGAAAAVSFFALGEPATLKTLGFLALPLSLMLSLVGFIVGALSFLAKEKKRYLALIGVILSLVGPICLLAIPYLNHE